MIFLYISCLWTTSPTGKTWMMSQRSSHGSATTRGDQDQNSTSLHLIQSASKQSISNASVATKEWQASSLFFGRVFVCISPMQYFFDEYNSSLFFGTTVWGNRSNLRIYIPGLCNACGLKALSRSGRPPWAMRPGDPVEDGGHGVKLSSTAKNVGFLRWKIVT